MLFSGIEKLEMKNWRPIQAIQAKVIGMLWRFMTTPGK